MDLVTLYISFENFCKNKENDDAGWLLQTSLYKLKRGKFKQSLLSRLPISSVPPAAPKQPHKVTYLQMFCR